MVKYFKDVYGCTAMLYVFSEGAALLKITTAHGDVVMQNTYNTERGARIAMGKCTDGGWAEVKC